MSLLDKPMKATSICPTGKIGYLTQLGAKVALAEVRRKRRPGEGEWEEYFCHICKYWHLTSDRG